MYFAQYYHKAVNSEELIEGCGDRSVFILDGRNSVETMKNDAKLFGKRYSWLAFHIEKGESFLRSRKITEIESI
jgi:hypothetical protein